MEKTSKFKEHGKKGSAIKSKKANSLKNREEQCWERGKDHSQNLDLIKKQGKTQRVNEDVKDSQETKMPGQKIWYA